MASDHHEALLDRMVKSRPGDDGTSYSFADAILEAMNSRDNAANKKHPGGNAEHLDLQDDLLYQQTPVRPESGIRPRESSGAPESIYQPVPASVAVKAMLDEWNARGDGSPADRRNLEPKPLTKEGALKQHPSRTPVGNENSFRKPLMKEEALEQHPSKHPAEDENSFGKPAEKRISGALSGNVEEITLRPAESHTQAEPPLTLEDGKRLIAVESLSQPAPPLVQEHGKRAVAVDMVGGPTPVVIPARLAPALPKSAKTEGNKSPD